MSTQLVTFCNPVEALESIRLGFVKRRDGYRRNVHADYIAMYGLRIDMERDSSICEAIVATIKQSHPSWVVSRSLTLALAKYVCGAETTNERKRASKIATVLDYFLLTQCSPDRALTLLTEHTLDGLAAAARIRGSERRAFMPIPKVMVKFSPAQLAEIVGRKVGDLARIEVEVKNVDPVAVHLNVINIVILTPVDPLRPAK